MSKYAQGRALILALILAPLAAALKPLSRPAILTGTAAAAAVRPAPVFISEAAEAILWAAQLNGVDGKAAVQRDACAAVVRAFGDGSSAGNDGVSSDVGGSAACDGSASRVTAVLPSGSGKTVLALRVAESLRAPLVVVLVPSIELVSQSYRDWERWREAPGHLDGWHPLAVCSSTSVPREELPRTTDADEIATFLATRAGTRVIYCTYHSAARVGEALRTRGERADLLVCDEAHRCTGRISKRDAQPLFDAFLPAARRLFLTATPRLIQSKRDADGELLAATMDDKTLFGKHAYRLGYAEAVRRGVVAPLKLVLLDVSSEYAAWAGRVAVEAPEGSAPDEISHDLVTERRLAELCLAMLDCKRSYGVRTAFAFSASNRRAADLERVAEAMLASEGFAVGRVDGTMLAQARETRLAPLRQHGTSKAARADVTGALDPTCLVTNCRVLAEGIDLPAVDLVVFADAKHSHVDILQCMGRASRIAPDKACGHVLVPVSEAAALAGEGGTYETAVSVIRAYAEQDEEFREALNLIVGDEARLGRPLSYSEWPAALQRVVSLPDNALTVKRLLGERMVATVARVLVDRWVLMLGLLQAFCEREGHADVPVWHIESDEALGVWLARQRSQSRAGRLLSARKLQLEALGVVWDVVAEKWERNLRLLRAYTEREGNANVPDRHMEDGERLGGWLSDQRKRYAAREWSEAERKRRQISAMSDEEVQRLEALGVVWDVLRTWSARRPR